MDSLLGNQFIDAVNGRGTILRTCLTESLLPLNKDSFRKGSNPLGKPIAASQLDIIAHSMGGLVSRQVTSLLDFKNDINYQKGIMHKLVTIGTPHRGTPLVNLMLLPDIDCVRQSATQPPIFTGRAPNVNVNVFNATIDGKPTIIPGAALQMEGNGRDIPTIQGGSNAALANLASIAPIGKVPTSLITGNIGNLLNNSTHAIILETVRGICRPDPIATRFARNKFDTIFDPNIYSKTNPQGSTKPTPNDGAVPVLSALDGITAQTNPQLAPATFTQADYAHSDSVQSMVGTTHIEQDSTGPIMNHVRKLLNERVKSSRFIRNK
jgi:hypothetical protein